MLRLSLPAHRDSLTDSCLGLRVDKRLGIIMSISMIINAIVNPWERLDPPYLISSAHFD